MRPVVLVIAALALVLGTGACDAKRATPAPLRPITYDGSTAISNKILPLALPLLEQRSGVKVQVERSGTGKGLKAMLAGQAAPASPSTRAPAAARAARGPVGA